MRCSSVLECEVTGSSDGLIVDSFHRGIETDPEERLMFFRWDAFNQMFDRMATLFQSAGEVLLYYEGVSAGEANATELLNKLGAEVISSNMPSVLRIMSSSGWGDAKLSGLDSTGAPIIRVDDCFECSTRYRVRRNCAFVRGIL